MVISLSTISTHANSLTRPDFTIHFYPVVIMGGSAHRGSKVNFLGEFPGKQLIDNLSREK